MLGALPLEAGAREEAVTCRKRSARKRDCRLETPLRTPEIWK